MNYLSDYEVCQILYFSGKISRLRSAGKKVEKEYASKQRKQVQQLLKSWEVNGITKDILANLKLHPSIDNKIKLNQFKVASSPPVPTCYAGPSTDMCGGGISHEVHEQHVFMDPDCDVEENIIFQRCQNNDTEQSERMTMIGILRFFAAFENIPFKKMTTLLQLFKKHKPEPLYQYLPNTGQELLHIDGFDVGLDEKVLPSPIAIGKGKYFHIGLENAMLGKSIGVLHQNADLMQFAAVYRQNPNLVPRVVIEKLRRFFGVDYIPELPEDTSTQLPHFELDINVDGVQVFDNSNAPGILPILGKLHSVRPNAISQEGVIIFREPKPFIIGYYRGVEKDPPINDFTSSLMEELIRLHPDNEVPVDHQRFFTAYVRCFICDAPMRSYMKRTVSHNACWSCDRCIQRGCKIDGIFQFKDVDAPLRKNCDFTKYYSGSRAPAKKIDSHIRGPSDMSPLLRINYEMVSRFVIDEMHTLYGAFQRRLQGFSGKATRKEGTLPSLALASVNSRLQLFKSCKVNDVDRSIRPLEQCNMYKIHELRQFLYYGLYPTFVGILEQSELEHVMLLQYGALLLGGFDNRPVPQQHIDEARTAFKSYSRGLVERGYPCTFHSHQIIHLPDDVQTFQCGLECLSAFPFEAFQKFFRNVGRSGNKFEEQIRNRLIERNKYLLPTTPEGELIFTSSQFKREVERTLLVANNPTIIYFDDRCSKWPKKLIFPSFQLTNRFPNNFCLLDDGNVFVCNDIKETSPGKVNVIGCKFNIQTDAFQSPFISSRFHMYAVSNPTSEIFELNATSISAKMWPFPRNVNVQHLNVSDPEQSWFVSPLRHTMAKDVTNLYKFTI